MAGYFGYPSYSGSNDEGKFISDKSSILTKGAYDGIILKMSAYTGVPEIQELTVENSRKEFKITTDVKEIDGTKGGNISGEDLHSLFQYLVNIDGERLIPQGVTGTYREVDGQMLLFPDRDGETFREIINQSFIELVATGEVDYERIYAIEVLNGTDIQNLARNCGNIYQSFGFDVVRVANASEQNYENTVVIDHISENPMAQVIAQLIRCERVVSPGVDEDLSQTEGIYWENSGYSVDFTIILGRDFNGRYVRN